MTTAAALAVRPGAPASAGLVEPPPDDVGDGDVEVESVLVGVCGTDHEIMDGRHGEPPAGEERLVLGHEAVGRVASAPSGTGLRAGDLVVPIVRRPDPSPCGACAQGEWDMCRDGRFTERGIKGAHGFARPRYRVDPRFAVRVPPSLGELAVLVETASVVAKAWEQIERIGSRAYWDPRRVLVTGAGPVGLLAALLARQRGFETHVLDRVDEGPKPALVEALGARYHTGSVRDACPPPDVVVECTGAGQVVLDVVEHTSRTGVVCLTGLASSGRTLELDAAALNRRLVLENDVVFGTVNANRRHFEAATAALAAADPAWLSGLVTREVPLARWEDALRRRPDDVKVALRIS